jgi:hypothetical protein
MPIENNQRSEPAGNVTRRARITGPVPERATIIYLGYAAWVGCEYRPSRGAQAGGTSAGLARLKPWL